MELKGEQFYMEEEKLTEEEQKPLSFEWWDRLMAFSMGVTTLTFIFCIFLWQWHWFARTGAFMVAVGIVLTGAQLVESDRLVMSKEFKPFYKKKADRWFGEWLGFRFLVVGTLIWGFGDLPSIIWTTNPLKAIR